MATRVLQTPSVLLVNDALDEREMYARTLRAYGCRVVKAATSVAAYEIAITGQTDIVVTDVHMTGSMNGLELTRRLRIHTRTATVPIIVLTSVSRPQDGDVALKAGANMFLELPVSANVLREQVVRLLDESGNPSQYASRQHEPLGRRRRQVVGLHQEFGTTPHANVTGPPSMLSEPNPQGSAASEDSPHADDRHCPQRCGLLQYQQRWPVLSVDLSTSNRREPRERLRYESGWFCTNPGCYYQDVTGKPAGTAR
jgi:CheY-like chemotaxis protein